MIWKGRDYRQARRLHQASLGINLITSNCNARQDQICRRKLPKLQDNGANSGY